MEADSGRIERVARQHKVRCGEVGRTLLVVSGLSDEAVGQQSQNKVTILIL